MIAIDQKAFRTIKCHDEKEKLNKDFQKVH